MVERLVSLAANHSLGFVATAAAISLISSWLALALLVRAREQGGWARAGSMALVASVAGLGVWTTHFVAMLGFRPDLLFGFDGWTTFASAIIGILCVGGPVAFAALAKTPLARTLLGAAAGLGVAAMHFTGMSAIRGCVVEHSWGTIALSSALGAALLGAALRVEGRGRLPAALLFVAGVCATHFTAVAAARIVAVTPAPDAVDAATLSFFVTCVAAVFLIAAFMWLQSALRIENHRRLGKRMLSTALDNMSNGLLLVDEKGVVRILNRRVGELLGLDVDSGLGLPWRECVRMAGVSLAWDERQVRAVISSHEAWLAAGGPTTTEHAMGNGNVLKITCKPLPAGGGVFTYDDVTVERRVQSQVAHMAFHDALTGLPNRRTFQSRLADRLAAGGEVALLLVDLDRFKQVNDTLGHAVGDDLLVEVGHRLRETAGPQDFIARLGGDEFVILHPSGTGSAEDLAARVIAALAKPVPVGKHVLTIGASIGLSAASGAGEEAAIMQQADLALYRAKARGRGQSETYEPGMHEEAVRRRKMEAALAGALSRNEFFLNYQPLYALSDGRLIGFEALIRWQSAEYGLVSPAEFIPLAEETGDILEIGDWVLREACRHIATLPSHLHVAVNVSPVQLHSTAILTSITRALADAGLTPDRIEVELTETAMVKDGKTIRAALSALRALGVRIAMDDFGTGYSSLAHLCEFDLDRIKIDRSFLEAAPKDGAAMAVLRAITQMGRDLGVPTIAEGVETQSQMALLRSLGCDAVQGFLLGRPMSADDTLALVGSEGAGERRSA